MTQINLGFGHDFATTPKISVHESPELPEHEQIWVFDLYYAKTLHELPSEAASTLREDLETWAVQFSSKVFMPLSKILEAGLERIDRDLTLLREDYRLTDRIYTVDVERTEGEWPVIRTHLPEPPSAAERQASVKGLGQFFFLKNKLFRRELPIHLLALRKFYIDGIPPDDPRSMVEGPLYALNKAMEYYQSQSGTLPGEADPNPFPPDG
jgi:hypothetical protein